MRNILLASVIAILFLVPAAALAQPYETDLQAISINTPANLIGGGKAALQGIINEKTALFQTTNVPDYEVSFYYNTVSTPTGILGKFITPIMSALTAAKTGSTLACSSTSCTGCSDKPKCEAQSCTWNDNLKSCVPAKCTSVHCACTNQKSCEATLGCVWDAKMSLCYKKATPNPLTFDSRGSLLCSVIVKAHSINGFMQQKVSCEAGLPAGGKYDVTMVISMLNEKETDAANNIKSKQITVSSSMPAKAPDIAITNAKLSGGKLLITVTNKGTATYSSAAGGLEISLEHLCVSNAGLCVDNPVLTTKCTSLPRGSCTLKNPWGVTCTCNFIYAEAFSVGAGETKELAIDGIPAPSQTSRIYIQAKSKTAEADSANNLLAGTIAP